MSAPDTELPAINPFKARLLSGRPVIGLWSTLASNTVAEVAALAGFDWILFDTEHSPNEPPGLVGQLQALNGSATAPIVRPAWNDAVLIKRLMDVGFHTLLVPFVQSAAEARAAVAATRYPPEGVRGVSVGSRGSRYGTTPRYWHRINAEMAVIVQIENQAGLDNLDAICAVPGVDCVFIGPNDLAASLGHIVDTAHPAVRERIRAAAQAIRAGGRIAGILAGNPDEAKIYLDMGYTFVGVGSDVGVLRNGLLTLRGRFEA